MIAGRAGDAPAAAPEDAEAGARAAQSAASAAPSAASAAPSVSSRASAAQHFELAFQLHKDALRFQMFILTACVFAHLYNVASSAMFFSSLYPVLNATGAAPRFSAVDAVLMSSHVLAIDVTSAMFVVAGFFSAYTFSNVPTADRAEICKIIAVYVLIDVWLAGGISVAVGSIFHLVRHSFRARDVALTALESALCLRALDVQQDGGHWHSLNPTAWPVLCLFWATLLTPLTLEGNERLRKCHQNASVVIPWVNACAPILVISLFALVHDNSNIFYMNAANVGYRVLEFNLGICVYSSMQACPVAFWRVAGVIGHLWLYVLAGFVTLWWAQLGAPVPPHDGPCIRMYCFSPCIEMHHGLLMRGCFLGVTLVCRVLTASEDAMQRLAACVSPAHDRALTASMAAVLLTWPACYATHLLLEFNFGEQIVRDNSALLALVVPHIALALALLWDTAWKPSVYVAVEGALFRVLGWAHEDA